MGMESHALDVWPAPLEPPEPLPRGPHSLPRDVVVRSQRTRMLRALIEVVAEKGYAATTVADVIGRAGVSRTTFYQQFKDKEDCFLVAYRKGADAQFRKVTEVVESATDPLEQLRRNVRAYLGSWSPTRRPRGPSCWRSRPPGPGRFREYVDGLP